MRIYHSLWSNINTLPAPPSRLLNVEGFLDKLAQFDISTSLLHYVRDRSKSARTWEHLLRALRTKKGRDAPEYAGRGGKFHGDAIVHRASRRRCTGEYCFSSFAEKLQMSSFASSRCCRYLALWSWPAPRVTHVRKLLSKRCLDGRYSRERVAERVSTRCSCRHRVMILTEWCNNSLLPPSSFLLSSWLTKSLLTRGCW